MEKQLFLVGAIQKPRGLKGEVRVALSTDFPEQFKKRKRFFIGRTEKDVREILVKHITIESKQTAFVQFIGVTTIDDAEKLKLNYLFIPESELTALSGDTAYIHDLIGLEARDENGKVGTLSDVLQLPSTDVYELTLTDGKKVHLPAILEFIDEVNVTNGFVKVKRLGEFL
jgi:16S rRNA processing protein RimM